MKESTQVLLGLGLGLAGGIAIAATHNPSLLSAADAIAPVGTLWVNAIRMTVIPLVVSLVITGVASASDVKAVGRLGGRTLAVFISMLAVATLIMIPLAIALFAWLRHLIPVRPSLPPGAHQTAASAPRRFPGRRGRSPAGDRWWRRSVPPAVRPAISHGRGGPPSSRTPG